MDLNERSFREPTNHSPRDVETWINLSFIFHLSFHGLISHLSLYLIFTYTMSDTIIK